MRIRTSHNGLFTTVLTEGGLLPSDFLQRLAAGDKSIEGLNPVAYHLDPNQKLNEAISDSWNAVVAAWKNFQEKKKSPGKSETGTTETRERWLQHLFKELGYGRLLTTKPYEIEGKKFEISHQWQKTPIHLISFKAPLDKRSEGIVGAARTSPHSMVQEFLNRSDDHLWAFLSNGLKLRILRDNVSLIRQAYIEFDLEAMLNGQVYPDFVLLWLLCHESRVESERPELCWLEKWTQSARQQGARALEDLRNGVQTAIEALGSGFLSSPVNTVLKEKLRSGTLSPQEYYRQLLRIVYRFLFLFVTEDRDVILVPSSSDQAKNTYVRYYSTKRLRSISTKLSGTKHADLWVGLQLIFKKIGTTGSPELALPALGSFLWSDSATPDLLDCNIANRDLLKAIRNLSFTEEDKIRRPVDYKNLGMKELGSVYEALLEQHPRLNIDSFSFELNVSAGNERKTTGSYYTDDSLVESLLDSALNPVLDEASKKPNPEEAILNLKVCDPGTGSGHFLIAAAHRMAKRLAAIRTGEDEPSPEALRTALRDIISHCIYGVDINPMAVELCKFTLWLEAMDPTKPLTFLDHHIKCGNSLLGTTPALLKQGIPDEAYEPIEGDDKKYCQLLKKRNKTEKLAVHSLFDDKGSAWLDRIENVRTQMEELAGIQGTNLEEVHKQENLLEQIQHSLTYQAELLHANAWCAAFVQEKKNDGRKIITEDWFRQIENNPDNTPAELKKEIHNIASQYQFFHWHLAFPEVFRVSKNTSVSDNKQTGWEGGFDVILGNPPWDKVQPEEQQFFYSKSFEIAEATGNKRKLLIEQLVTKDIALYKEWHQFKRNVEVLTHFIKYSNRYSYSNKGRLNTYSLFLESCWNMISLEGSVGMIVQTGLVVDDSNKELFDALVTSNAITSIYDFENKELLFPAVHAEQRFVLVTLSNKAKLNGEIKFAFWLHRVDQLIEPNRIFTLTRDDLRMMSPNTGACPTFHSMEEARIIKRMYEKTQALFDEKAALPGWEIKPTQFINLTSDSQYFISGKEKNSISDLIPVYEAKNTQIYDHRYSTIVFTRKDFDIHLLTEAEHKDSELEIETQFYLTKEKYKDFLSTIKWHKEWYLTFHDIANPNNERTSVFSIIPSSAVGNSAPIITSEMPTSILCCLLALCNSRPFDFVTRRRIVSRHLNFFVLKQLPAPQSSIFSLKAPWEQVTLNDWIKTRCLELSYTSYSLKGFAKDLGYDGNPFVWNEERRNLLMEELDAAFFHIYSIERLDVNYILDTFNLTKKADEEKFGEYRTKRLVLEIYDEMAEAIRIGVPYKTRLDPPPADPRVAHPAKVEISLEQLRWLVLLRAITEIERQKKKEALKVYSVKILYIAEVCSQIAQQYPWTLQQHGPYPEGKHFDAVLEQMRSQGLITIGRLDSQVNDIPIRPTDAGSNLLIDLESKYGLLNQRQVIEQIVNDFKQCDGRDMELRATLVFIHKNNTTMKFDNVVTELMKIKPLFRSRNNVEQVLIDLMKSGYIPEEVGEVC